MGPLLWLRKQKLIIATLLWLMILACGSLERLQQTSATETVIVGEDDQLNISKAYEQLQTLSGYHLESEYVVRDGEGNRTRQTVSSQYDSNGNAYFLIQNPDGQQGEVYFVDGQTYVFETEYEGWVNLGARPPAEVSQTSNAVSPVSLELVEELMQRLTESGVGPTVRGPEMLFDRPVTRYAIADTIEAFGSEPAGSAIDLRGSLWIDDESGAILKLEMFFYENEESQPAQELVLEISDIGNVPPITAPAPIVDPTAMAVATATAQIQTVLPTKLNYQGEPVSFEMVPLQAKQVPDSSPRSTEIQIVLRELPDHLFQETSFEPFLAQIRERLTLSIPERNLIVTSSGFRLEESDPKNHTLEVLYLFNADLADLSYVELILSGQGNPIFAPVPVE